MGGTRIRCASFGPLTGDHPHHSSPAALCPSERLTASQGLETTFYVGVATMCCGPWGAEAWISPRLSPSSPHHNLSDQGARHSIGPFLWLKLTPMAHVLVPNPHAAAYDFHCHHLGLVPIDVLDRPCSPCPCRRIRQTCAGRRSKQRLSAEGAPLKGSIGQALIIDDRPYRPGPGVSFRVSIPFRS